MCWADGFYGWLHIAYTNCPLQQHLLQPASLFGRNSRNLQAAQEPLRFDRAAGGLHDLSHSECATIVCARCGSSTISETAADFNGLWRLELTTDRGGSAGENK